MSWVSFRICDFFLVAKGGSSHQDPGPSVWGSGFTAASARKGVVLGVKVSPGEQLSPSVGSLVDCGQRKAPQRQQHGSHCGPGLASAARVAAQCRLLWEEEGEEEGV
jgi:hypothetical protein